MLVLASNFSIAAFAFASACPSARVLVIMGNTTIGGKAPLRLLAAVGTDPMLKPTSVMLKTRFMTYSGVITI
ncbi:hypothetical protein JG687_00017058 [Phytophthora cactorum]|uniref:Uncharacterized protein n=1 Tax=Phytophthora cactorum TaxID=29920 RepID=A0A329SSQ5_9STRA|nr:hypothetical protein Pcac1_g12560 [Phytophthora cactorum]KAG3167937.1 hypothetical protein PI126_g3551 [Phytophthora idaei]KAG2829749.1 hypothetical protein PC112_g7978 [Phytophthora cactorum]KAG2839876.1 hypothetical protein PC111_g3690 [Phytophthora cactorum]KAG2865351.1 hypothetical protein PC113_g3784 [Phytophthora cactorum]